MKEKESKHVFKFILLAIIFIVAICSFIGCIVYKDVLENFNTVLISESLLFLFTLMYISFLCTHKTKKNTIINIASILLIVFYLFNMNYRLNFASIFSNKVKVPDFTNKNITDIIKWSEKNGVGIDQVYEYSEIIKENKVITQDNYDYIDKDNIVTISVSDGVDPSKEIIIPDMTSWSVERVVKYIKENYLSNIVVDFNESDRKENTLISQSKIGTVKRDDEILLAFSLGEKVGDHEIKLRDLKNMDKIDAIVYLKQNQLDYELKEDFSNKIKKGKVSRQDITPGSSVKKDDKVVITISKGKEIIVPNLKDMNIKEISNWAIKNKLRLEFVYKHDESIKKNKVISSNFNYKDKVKEKETLKIVLSSGKLKMPKFKNLDEFYAWAKKYNIKYKEEHEFSDTVKQGEVISYSYKKGETIKNDDTIIIKISDGKNVTMPNLVGLSKSAAKEKLDKLKINYTFTYKNSDKAKNTVLEQSIAAGSKTASNITVNLTLSTGVKPSAESTPSQVNNYSKPAQINNSSANSTKPQTNSCTTKTTVYLYEELYDFSNPSGTCSKIKSTYPKVKFNCQYKSSTGITKGIVINAGSIDSRTFTNCDTVTLQISS